MLPAINIKRTRDRHPNRKTKDFPKFKVGDLLIFKCYKKQNQDAKYMPNLHICKVKNEKGYDLQDPAGHIQHATVPDIQLLMPAECIVSMLLNVRAFRWACKYINDPFLMPDLQQQDRDQNDIQKLDQNPNAVTHRYNL